MPHEPMRCLAVLATALHVGYCRKRLNRMTLVPQYGKAVERFVIIRMQNAFNYEYVGVCTWMI